MKEIRNTTTHPLRVTLPGGKILHLGPHQTGQVADKAVEHPDTRKLIEDGSVEVLGEGAKPNSPAAADPGRAETHGSAKHVRGHRGDR